MLLDTPNKKNFITTRTHTIIWVLASTGIRARELRELKIKNVDMINRAITVYVIENWIYNYLIKNNLKSVMDSEIEYKLIEWLLTNHEIKKLETQTIDKRIIAKIIFTVNCNMDKKSRRITHCWGENILKTVSA